jgi:hypothetical protein
MVAFLHLIIFNLRNGKAKMSTRSRRYVSSYRRKWQNASALPTIIVTLLVCVACWVFGYSHKIGFPVQRDACSSLVWEIVLGWLSGGLSAYLIGFLLLLLAAGLIQRLNYLFMIIQGKTTLPFLIFLLLNSVIPDLFPVHPVSLALPLLLFAMFELFGSYQRPDAIGRIFNMMFYIGLGSLIWPYALWFAPVFIVGLYLFRILNSRTLGAALLSLLTFFMFVSGWCLLKNDFALLTNLATCLTDIHLLFTNVSWITDWPTLVFFFLILLFLSIHVSLEETERTIRTRQFLTFLFLFGFVSFLLSLLYAPHYIEFVVVFFVPVSIVGSKYFSEKYGVTAFLSYYFLMALMVISLLLRSWNF